MTGRGNVTLQPRNRGRGGRRRSLHRRSRRALELPDRARRAASSPRPRPGRWTPQLGDPAQTAAQPELGVRGPGPRRPDRDRGRGVAPGPIDVAAPGLAAQPRRRRRLRRARRVRRRARRLHVHRPPSCPTACNRRSNARRTATRRPDEFEPDRAVVHLLGARRGPTDDRARAVGGLRARRRRCARSGTASTIRPAPTTAPGIHSRWSRCATRCRARSANGSAREGHERRWLPPSADFTVHVLGEARCDWILAVNRARHAGEGYASADMEMWDVEAARPAWWPTPPR